VRSLLRVQIDDATKADRTFTTAKGLPSRFVLTQSGCTISALVRTP
jgi:hypothetical protein